MEYQSLLYNSTYKLPDRIWDKEDVKKMIEFLKESNNYLNSIYGEWMKARDILIISMLFEHALRPRELLKMKFEDLDLKNKTLKIRGENNKTRKDRLLPINQNVVIYFINYFNFPRWIWKGSDYLFPSFQNKFLSPERWKCIFREKVLKPLGLWIKPEIPSKCKTRSYTLRHSKATELINKTDIYTVANILGHGDIRSTKSYLHLNKELFEKMRQSLNS